MGGEDGDKAFTGGWTLFLEPAGFSGRTPAWTSAQAGI